MKKLIILVLVSVCMLNLVGCSNVRNKDSVAIEEEQVDISINSPENVYVTFHSGADMHEWELSEDEINSWVDWINNLDVSPINLEESKMLIDYMYHNGSTPQYSFDIGREDSLQRIAYFEADSEHGYININNEWYHTDNPTEPFNRY